MRVGLVCPTPGPESVVDADLWTLIREETGATHVRFNLDYRHPDPLKIVGPLQQAGFILLPILDFTYDHDPDMHAYLTFCQDVVVAFDFEEVEILNEPRVMGGWSGKRYGTLARQVCEYLEGQTVLILAGDYLQPDRAGPQIHRYWFEEVRATIPDDAYDRVAWHTYREPSPPSTSRNPTRWEEYAAMARPLPDEMIVQVTEVGWNLAGVNQADQGAYIAEELRINLALGIEATYIYAPVPGNPEKDFGLFNHDWTPRPSALAIKEFCTQVP